MDLSCTGRSAVSCVWIGKKLLLWKAGPAIQGVLEPVGPAGLVRTKWGLPVLGGGWPPGGPFGRSAEPPGQGRASRALRPSLQPPSPVSR